MSRKTQEQTHLEYWGTRHSACSLTRTAHSFACASLLASHCSLRTASYASTLRCVHSLVRSLAHSLLSSWESEWFMSQNDLILSHSAATRFTPMHLPSVLPFWLPLVSPLCLPFFLALLSCSSSFSSPSTMGQINQEPRCKY